jgi:hypothetical protein
VPNARDAMPAGGRVRIATGLAATAPRDLPAGRYVSISVADTGVGVGEEDRAHPFDPFFATKEQGEGTGLGLATVYGFVRHAAAPQRSRASSAGRR